MSKTYDDIDRELSLLSKASRRLRRERNGLTRTCRLPPEVLAMIFLSVIDIEPLAEPQDFTAPRIKNWFPILHVCKRWREVALECPVLWNRVDVTSPQWTAEMLRLSKKAALSLKAEGYSTHSRVTRACKQVLAHSERLQTLHLSGFRECLVALGADITEAPNLRSLVLRHCHWLADVDILELPATFLEQGAPRLERLELQKCAVSWDSLLLTSSPNVMNLVIQGLEQNKPTYTQLLRTLGNMPSLRHLHLENTLPVPYSGAVDVSPIHLPLQTLHISGTSSELACFFRHFSIPTSVSTTITCRQPAKLEDVADFISAFVQSRRGITGKCLDTLSSWSLSFTPHSFFLGGSTNAVSHATSSGNIDTMLNENSLSLTINMASKSDLFLWDAIQTLLRDLPIAPAAISSLIINDDSNFIDCNRWRYLLQHMPNISTLRAFRWSALHLPLALDPTRAYDDAKGKEKFVPAPRLEVLDLHNVNMSWTAQPSNIPLLHALQDAQIARTNCALPMPIDELHLSGCLNVGKQEVGTLCHLFTEVDWDGFELYVPSLPRRDSSVEREGEWVLSFGWEDWHTT